MTADATANLISAAQVLVAIVAVIVAIATIRQKRQADNRAAWWNRLQWTLDKITSNDPVDQAAGFRLLPVVTKSSLDSVDDERLADTIDELRDDLAQTTTDAEPVDSETATKEES